MKNGTVNLKCCRFLEADSSCPAHCDDGSEFKFSKAASAYDIFVPGDRKATVEAIQRELMEHGPIEVQYQVMSDFAYYRDGVYSRSPSSVFSGSHAVTLLGWGVQFNEPYWLIANSWGNWGISGTFFIARGKNECGVEDQAVAGLPAL